jgi:YebC/PmpR family DNA-binding regulatory protein
MQGGFTLSKSTAVRYNIRGKKEGKYFIMGRAHEVRAAAMAKTAAMKSKLYSRYGKELYIAAKSGVPDPDMNLTLARKIKEAKSNQVPADVIKRAIEKAKGNDGENYEEARYEGFGPGNSTIIVDCLTDNTNRSYTNVKTAFNKCHGAKIAGAGAVSFGYEQVGLFYFPYEDEEKMLDAMMEADVDVQDMSVEDGEMMVKTAFGDFSKAQDAIEKLIPDVKFDKCEVTMLANETVTLTDEEDKASFQKLMDTLNEIEDVNKIYTNVEGFQD